MSDREKSDVTRTLTYGSQVPENCLAGSSSARITCTLTVVGRDSGPAGLWRTVRPTYSRPQLSLLVVESVSRSPSAEDTASVLRRCEDDCSKITTAMCFIWVKKDNTKKRVEGQNDVHCCHIGTAIKHPVSDRVKPVIWNFWHPGTLTLRAERQSARMSKITNDGLTRCGTGCFMAVPIWQ